MANTNAVVEGGRWVRISGLQSPAGQKLNGKVGQVLNEQPTSNGRFQIKIDGDKSQGKEIKPTNFVNVSRDELVKVCRLPAHGEGDVVDTEQPKCLLFPKDHSMFTKCSPKGNSSVMEMVGVPLMVTKTKPYTNLSGWGAGDNQKATYLMIKPNDGLAPMEWQRDVGPVLVYRPGGLDFGFYDMWAVHSFICNLLDKYGESGTFDPRSWLSPDRFRRIISEETFASALNILTQDETSAQSARPAPRPSATSLCNKRYKELRKAGMSTQEAMATARQELGLDQADNVDPGQAVGQMFGLR